MKKLFNVGDRVKVYCSYGVMKATVIYSEADDKPVLGSWYEPSLHVQFDENFSVDGRSAHEKRAYVHPKQCRRLKGKTKRKNLSADDLARAWNNTVAFMGVSDVAASSTAFKKLRQALGFEEES